MFPRKENSYIQEEMKCSYKSLVINEVSFCSVLIALNKYYFHRY